MADAYILDAVRTPRGRGKAGKGALSGVHPQELFAQALNQLAKRTGVAREDVEDVVVGCVSQVNEQGACIARNAVLAAGWPETVTGVSLNRFCGSGAQAVGFAAMGILSGQQQLVVGGGVESMSRVPMGSDGGQIDGLNMALRKKVTMVPQGISADLIATRERFGRADLDRFALASQEKAERAQREGRFAKSLFPVVDENGKVLLDKDEHPRAGTTLESLGKLEPAFTMMGAAPVGPNGETFDELARLRYRTSPRSSTCTRPATRAGSSTARPPCCSRRPSTRRRTASARARASARWRRPAPSPSSCSPRPRRLRARRWRSRG
jgi:acetyl-CoA C-acetyltransferase